MRNLLLDSAGQPDDLRGQAPLAGLQDPAVRVGETGEGERQQVRERALGVIEAGLELAGRHAQRRDGGVTGRGHGAARIAQQGLAGGDIGRDAPGREEGLGLAGAQAVAREGVGQARLLGARERGEGVRGGCGQPAGVNVSRHGRRKPTAEGQAAVHPAAAATEQLGDLRGRELVVVRQ
jgi:hypothetical protein